MTEKYVQELLQDATQKIVALEKERDELGQERDKLVKILNAPVIQLLLMMFQE